MGSCLDRCLSWSGRTNSYSSPSGRMSPLSPSSSPWVQGAATPINLEENICTGSISKQQWQWLHSPPMKRSYTCTVYIYIEYTWIYHNMPIIYYIPRTGRRWPRFRSKTKVTQALGVCVFIYIYISVISYVYKELQVPKHHQLATALGIQLWCSPLGAWLIRSLGGLGGLQVLLQLRLTRSMRRTQPSEGPWFIHHHRQFKEQHHLFKNERDV